MKWSILCCSVQEFRNSSDAQLLQKGTQLVLLEEVVLGLPASCHPAEVACESKFSRTGIVGHHSLKLRFIYPVLT